MRLQQIKATNKTRQTRIFVMVCDSLFVQQVYFACECMLDCMCVWWLFVLWLAANSQEMVFMCWLWLCLDSRPFLVDYVLANVDGASRTIFSRSPQSGVCFCKN